MKLSMLNIVIVNCWFLYIGASSTIVKQKSFVDLKNLVC